MVEVLTGQPKLIQKNCTKKERLHGKNHKGQSTFLSIDTDNKEWLDLKCFFHKLRHIYPCIFDLSKCDLGKIFDFHSSKNSE
jgi:hypothetical protein